MTLDNQAAVEGLVHIDRQRDNETGTTVRCYRVRSRESGVTLGRVRRCWRPERDKLGWYADGCPTEHKTRWEAIRHLLRREA